MLSPKLVRFIDSLASEIKAENPDLHVDDTTLKAVILDKVRDHANAEADLMLELAYTNELVKLVADLARLQA